MSSVCAGFAASSHDEFDGAFWSFAFGSDAPARAEAWLPAAIASASLAPREAAIASSPINARSAASFVPPDMAVDMALPADGGGEVGPDGAPSPSTVRRWPGGGLLDDGLAWPSLRACGSKVAGSLM